MILIGILLGLIFIFVIYKSSSNDILQGSHKTDDEIPHQRENFPNLKV